MSYRSSPNRPTAASRQSHAGLVARSAWAAVRALGVLLCLALGRGADAQGTSAFAAAAAPSDDAPAMAARPGAPRPVVARPVVVVATTTSRRASSRFAMTPTARGSLQALWRSSVRANEERVACLGGERGEDGVVRITRVYHLVPKAADSANASAGPSLATCRPPRWFGTVHTHIITNPDGEPYVEFSGPDRDVMSRWEQAWRSEGVFCLLYSHATAHCVTGRVGAADLTYAPAPPAGAAPRALRMVASER